MLDEITNKFNSRENFNYDEDEELISQGSKNTKSNASNGYSNSSSRRRKKANQLQI